MALIPTDQAERETQAAIAALAGEIEELAEYGDVALIVERLRARVRAAGLVQSVPGATEAYAPRRHQVLGARPSTGADVTVMRPSYADTSGLVIAPAVVISA